MKYQHIAKILAGLALGFGLTPSGSAQLTISVDMDTVTPGIQSSITVAAGATFSVDLWAAVGPAGLSSFSVSTTFDTAELQLNPTAGGAASQPALPGGLSPFGGPTENNALGQVYSFNGVTVGAGPASTSFILGSIAFTAPTPITDGSDDVLVGYFNFPTIVDDAFDNTLPLGASYLGTTTFVGGKVNVVPEPAEYALIAGIACVGAAWLRRRQKRS